MAFIPLEHLSALHDGYKRAFVVAGQHLLLIHDEGRSVLIENRCPHMDVALETGVLVPGGAIRCRAHGIEFELESGRARGPLAATLDCLKRFPIVYQGTQLGVDL